MTGTNLTSHALGRTKLGKTLHLPFKGDVVSRVGLICLVALLLVAILGPALPVGNADALGAGSRLAAPSVHFPFGTDSLGRSLLPRVIEGVRNSFLAAAIAVAITTVLAIGLGTVAAYKRGAVDAVVSRMSDVLFAFPSILLALLITAIVGPGESGAVIAIVVVTLPLMTRVVRSAALGVSRRDFIVASEVSGAPLWRIVVVHLVPNVAGAVALQMSYAMSVSMLLESGLSFLGLGIQPPDASLGSLVQEGIDYMTFAPWLIFFPGVVLAIAVLSVNLVGDGLRDRFEPQEARSLT